MGGDSPAFPSADDPPTEGTGEASAKPAAAGDAEPQRGRPGTGRKSKKRGREEPLASDEEASTAPAGGPAASTAPLVAESANAVSNIPEELVAEPSALPPRRSAGKAAGAVFAAVSEPSESFRKALGSAVRETALAERREARERLCRDVRRLGRFRRGILAADNERDAAAQWAGGDEAQQLKALRERVEEQKKFVQESRKSLSAKKVISAADSSTGAAVSQEEIDDEIWELRELCNSKKAAWEREEMECREREQRLAADRDDYLKQQRAIEVEDNLAFGSFPPLHPRYTPLRLMSKNTSATIYRAYDLIALRLCVLSVHHVDTKTQDWQLLRQRASVECQQLKELRHSSLVMLLDFVSHHAGSFVVVWEHIDGDTLETYLKRNGPLEEKHAKGIVLQLLSVLRFLESQGKRLQAHALRPGRLIFRSGEVKVAGTALLDHLRVTTSPSTRTFVRTNSCTLNESPPQSCRSGGGQDADALDDVLGCDWARSAVRSIGVTLHEMLFGRPPEAVSVTEPPAAIQLPEQPKISTECREFLCRVLDSDRRLTVQQACNEPFVLPPQRPNGKRASA